MASLRSPTPVMLLALLLSGCGCNGGDDDAQDGGLLDAAPDSEVPDAPPAEPDASGPPCETDEDCADEIECTSTRCNPETLTCETTPDDTVCADTLYCNGDERCSPTEGCVPGPSRSCNDDDVCTIDLCNEESRCLHRGRDFDGDGHNDWHCKGGDDCNDNDPRIYQGGPEICGDEVDNNCDGLTDFEPGAECTSPGFDSCDEPLDITGGGAFQVSLAGTVRDYAPSCGFGANNDVVLTFTLAEAADVHIVAESEFALTTLALETECGVSGSELECNWGFPAEVRARNVAPGTYYVIAQAQSAGDLLVTLDILAPTPAPTNETCEGAIDVSAGGHFASSFLDVADDYEVSCGFGAYPDLVYTFTIAEVSDVDLTASSGFRYIPLAVETTCGDEATEVRCRSAPSQQHLYGLPAGTYYVIVEGSGEFDFGLDVAFSPPTSPPDGDLCSAPIDVSAGGIFAGSLVGMQDDVEVSCSPDEIEEVFLLDLAAPKDVTLRVDGESDWMTVALQETCNDVLSEVGCRSGIPATLRVLELPAGQHTVVVESFRAVDFTLDVSLSDPVVPTAVDSSDTCATGFATGTNGGVFSGNTDEAANDYDATCGNQARGPDEAYFVQLLFSARLTITLETDGWDGVMHLHQDTCLGAADQIVCNDRAVGGKTLIEVDVAADNFYIVVDGRTAADHGAYTLDILVTPTG